MDSVTGNGSIEGIVQPRVELRLHPNTGFGDTGKGFQCLALMLPASMPYFLIL
jgi:hypothetical protein